MSQPSTELRAARPGDADEIARLFLIARRHSMGYLPELHSDEETRRWIGNIVLRQCAVTVAVLDRQIVGFAAVHDGMLEHLYVLPAWHGRGIGDALLSHAKTAAPEGLRLHVFQQNSQARRFYEKRGFGLVELGDGTGNEEKVPDALYAWTGS